MTRYGIGARFSSRDEAVPSRVGAHRTRLTRRRKRRFQFERLEDRLVMEGSGSGGPGFVENLPAPTEPNEWDANPIVIQATLSALDDYLAVDIDAVGAMLRVLSNDWGPDGQSSLRITSVTATKLGGQIEISADGRSLVYTPPSLESEYDATVGGLFAGKDSFAYVVEDGVGRISQANVAVNLFTPLRGPQDDHLKTLEDELNVVLGVLANDEEFAGGTIVAVGEATNGGTVSISEDGKKLLYTPTVGFKGHEYFSYTVEDADGYQATARVWMHVQARLAVNHDRFEIDVDSPLQELDVLANDYSRGSHEPPRIVAVDLPENFVGSLTISADGQKLLFEPAAGFLGSMSFQYTVRYGPAEHHTATANSSIQVIDPYLAVDNWFMVDPDSVGNVFDVQANDPELRQHRDLFSTRVPRTITAVSASSAGGVIEIVEGGTKVRYTPVAGFSGDETFEYSVIDAMGHLDTARVTVHVAFEESDPFNLPRFRHPGELAQFLIDEAVQRYAEQFSLQQRVFVSNVGGVSVDAPAYDGSFYTRLMADGMMLNADYSSTNVQHEGIDEADVVETDGDFIYTLTSGRLVIVDVRDLAHPHLVSITQFERSLDEMYLQGDRLTLISRDGYLGKALVAVLDVSDRGEPELLERTEIDGWIVDTRAIGDRVYVVTQQSLRYPAPTTRVIAELPVEDGSGVWQVTAYETLDEYIERVGDTLADLLPQFKTYNGAGELVATGPLSAVNQIHKPISKADSVLASLVTFDIRDDTAGPITSTGLFTNSSDSIYVSPSAVYVLRTDSPRIAGSNGTRILKFEFAEDGTISLEAAGSVTGRILNQFSLDEYDSLLRIVTTETSYDSIRRVTRTQNHLFVLEHVGTALRIVGSLERLAPTEEVKSVRFVGDRAYVVTFRVVDPLFTIDLNVPTAPRVAGAIKIPGYSSYLQPVGEHYVLGIGRDADEVSGELGAAQISLFDVNDFENPVLVDRMTLSGVDWFSSEALFDHHAIAYFAEHQVLSIPISWQHTTEEDIDGDGVVDHWHSESGSAAFVFQIDVDGANVGIEFAGRIDHDSTVRRSVRIGDALVTISSDYVKIHELSDLKSQLAEVYLGNLLRDDQFDALEDSGLLELDVRANDRPGNAGEPLPIVSVTQPESLGSYGWLGGGGLTDVGVVKITADGNSVLFMPAENFFGTATFTYTVFDEVRGMQTATVTVIVENVPDVPDALDDEFAVELGAVAVPLYVLANDVNFDQGQSNYSWLSTDRILFDVDYLHTNTLLQTTTLTSISASDAVAMPITSNLVLGGIVRSVGWLSKGLKVTQVGEGDQGGSILIDDSGQFVTYTPAEGFEGIETFTYTIETQHGLTDTARVAVRIGKMSDDAWATVVAESKSVAERVPRALAAISAAAADVALSGIDFGIFPIIPSIEAGQAIRPSVATPRFGTGIVSDLLSLSVVRLIRSNADATATTTDEALADWLSELAGEELSEKLPGILTAKLARLPAGF